MISIVMPVYNEGRHIAHSVETVENILKNAEINYEFVLVDDGSKDNSWEELSKMSESDPAVRSIRLSRNFGKEAALCAGLDETKGEAVVVLDSDLQHPPELIPEFVRIWREEDVDVVEGVKSDRGKESGFYRGMAKLFYGILLRLTGIDLRNASDFKLLDRNVVTAMQEMPEKITFFRGMSAWVGFNRRKVPFEVKDRVEGTSKWTFGRLVSLAVTSITSYASAPLKLIIYLGILMFVISVGLGIQTLVRYFMGNSMEGFTTVILLILFIGSAIMICLGIIGLYLERIYHEIKGRPRYIISRRKN
ncbi:MAG: glycosyltransferase family 2 protein [Lachnospiraceae bacterium]|nr:glycosyltransferase family 2 protein [Lachnospiraceae bacterium]